MKTIFVAVSAIALSCLSPAQDPLTSDAKASYTLISSFFVSAAEAMPEKDYSFHPVPAVRTFGQVVGHIADNQFMWCSAVTGEHKKSTIEETIHSKGDLLAKLKAGVAYCDSVYASFHDSDAPLKINAFGRERTKLSTLDFNTGHVYEHYGTLATYMRIKGLTPPSSEKSK
jgi:uncharacterized damage-inducible protein DinB